MKPLPDKIHILLIEPGEKSGTAFKSALNRFKFEITLNTGNNILAVYEQAKPDFVLCYIKHKLVTSGYAVITDILEKFPKALIIGISLEFNPSYQKKLETIGAGYIAKKLIDPQGIKEYLQQFHAEKNKDK